jgi:hypothetical protein
LEDQGDYDRAQDFAGRGLKYFKGRRSGFMPEYADRPIMRIREFLFPYYQRLFSNVKSRRLDKTRTLRFQADTNGFLDPAIPPY